MFNLALVFKSTRRRFSSFGYHVFGRVDTAGTSIRDNQYLVLDLLLFNLDAKLESFLYLPALIA